MDTHDSELKKELNATLQARRELGEEYDSALVDSFLEKIDQRLDGRNKQIRRELAEQQLVVARGASSPRSTHEGFGERHGFGIVSLVLAVPLSAIAGSLGHLAGLLVAWIGIVGVNMVHSTRFGAWARHGRRSERED
ncbi:hypothetical protein [Streptomyces montanisoli]|uniref:Integral membrane protein n=1 Tax=Streptomyces montanisoli TaxID=2798581 RepID=A0A940M730_9ACTN|nr:hypothetical protein [Streptomyces montanisoli]MBP0457380.1 hypothetical protein [Streptomyces montanisoli]